VRLLAYGELDPPVSWRLRYIINVTLTLTSEIFANTVLRKENIKVPGLIAD